MNGWGRFLDEPCAFEITHYRLPRAWDFPLCNGEILWHLFHNGTGRIQLDPPGGLILARTERFQTIPSFLVRFRSDDIAFTNFDGAGKFSSRFSPDQAAYLIEHDGWRVETVCELAGASARMRLAITNTGKRRALEVMPVLRPHLAAGTLAPWDVPELYQTIEYNKPVFTLRAMSPAGIAEERQTVYFTSDLDADEYAIDYLRFIGGGSWERPETVFEQKHTALKARKLVAALRRRVELESGGTFRFSITFGKSLDAPRYHWKPSAARRVELPDTMLTRYVNEWLDYQGEMVVHVHRGWPVTLLGTRDAAQDYLCILPTKPQTVRAFLKRLFDVQRPDGSFPRQFSPDGKHDERKYVDSGFWVWELLYKYICQTRDWSILDDRARLALDYLRNNLGEHGLVKIFEGDWNDAVNRAGLRGRGESVMASCMAVIAWEQAARLLKLPEYRAAAEKMRTAIRLHALNGEGFLNGVYNDDGRWIFSDRDPDGASRLNVPVNAFGILADVVDPVQVFARIKRTEHGVPLFWPPFSEPGIPNVGRVATGDLPAGLAENGAPYNHGSHGFLARAAAKAGRGEDLLDLLLWLFPYDQQRHPVARTKTPPYAIVNVWKTASGWDGEGGDTFFSGSIGTGLRAVYEGLLGIEPVPEGLALHPCLPAAWPGAEAVYPFGASSCHITICRGGAGIAVNGQELGRVDWIPAELLERQQRNEIVVSMP